jgi:hypothetical protein
MQKCPHKVPIDKPCELCRVELLNQRGSSDVHVSVCKVCGFVGVSAPGVPFRCERCIVVSAATKRGGI